MMLIYLLPVLYLSTNVESVTLKIDGFIDLGQNWNIRYNFDQASPAAEQDSGVYLRLKGQKYTNEANALSEGTTEPMSTKKHLNKHTTTTDDLLAIGPVFNEPKNDSSEKNGKKKKRKHRHNKDKISNILRSLNEDTYRIGSQDSSDSENDEESSESDEESDSDEENSSSETNKITKIIHTVTTTEITVPTKTSTVENTKRKHKIMGNTTPMTSSFNNLDMGNTFKYLETHKENVETTMSTVKNTKTTTNKAKHKMIHNNGDGIFRNHAVLVKDDETVQEFITSVRSQSMGFFAEMKSKIEDTRTKNKVDFLSKSYEEKFNEFIKETNQQKIMTRLGTQKVILNIIDMSNRILKRLVNYYLADLQRTGALRIGTIGDMEEQLNNEERQEYITACIKYNVCRTKDRFSLFASEFLTEIVSASEDKIKLAVGCLTEVLKDFDYTKFVNKKDQNKIVQGFEDIELFSGKELKPLLIAYRNMLVSKNRPLIVMVEALGSPMNKSVAFLDLVDAIDDKLPPTEGTLNEWDACLKTVKEWVLGLRNDACDIMTKFTAQILEKAVPRLKGKAAEKVGDNLRILFKPEVVREE